MTWEMYDDEESARRRRDNFALVTLFGVLAGRHEGPHTIPADVIAAYCWEQADAMVEKGEEVSE